MAKIININEKNQLNLLSLQREDRAIAEILGNAAHVVVYKFDNIKCQWDRVGVEGSAFVVTATTQPFLRLLVLNRLYPNTYTLDITQVTKIKLQSPYLMLRLSSNEQSIMGIWSHEESDRQTIKDAMESGIALMSSKISTSTSIPSTNATSSNQLKKLLTSPKKDPPVPSTQSQSQQQLSPPIIDSHIPHSDPDDFLTQLSQNTNSFHASTHVGGRPISPLPPRATTTPSPTISEDSNKTRALAQVLSLASRKPSTSSSIAGIALLSSPSAPGDTGDGFLTDSEITATANVLNRVSSSSSPNVTYSVNSPSMLSSSPSVSIEFLSPSDLTGVKKRFPKMIFA